MITDNTVRNCQTVHKPLTKQNKTKKSKNKETITVEEATTAIAMGGNIYKKIWYWWIKFSVTKNHRVLTCPTDVWLRIWYVNALEASERTLNIISSCAWVMEVEMSGAGL